MPRLFFIKHFVYSNCRLIINKAPTYNTKKTVKLSYNLRLKLVRMWTKRQDVSFICKLLYSINRKQILLLRCYYGSVIVCGADQNSDAYGIVITKLCFIYSKGHMDKIE